jgi:type 1 glutamine amidotransferase
MFPAIPCHLAVLSCLLFSAAALAQPAPAAVATGTVTTLANAKKTKIVFIAGPDSHGFDQHAHSAGLKLLEKCIKAAYPQVETVLFKGWPTEAGALDGASAIILFSDGGGGNPMLKHIDRLDELMEKGVGFACIHYAVEVPKGKAGDLLKQWIGGYFETFWSVNPHWTAEFKEFPKHPVANGLKPFKLRDEWYYHLRFVDDMKGVTPILSAVPPEKTREGRDGQRSGNEHVRARKGMAEHVAWVVERADGGRGFGTTGGHFHWNWGCDGFRTCVLNGVAWIAKLDIPSGGVPSPRPTAEDLLGLLEREPPKGLNLDHVRKIIKQSNP